MSFQCLTKKVALLYYMYCHFIIILLSFLPHYSAILSTSQNHLLSCLKPLFTGCCMFRCLSEEYICDNCTSTT